MRVSEAAGAESIPARPLGGRSLPSAIRHPVAGGRRAGKPPLLVWPKQLLVNNHNVGDYKMIFLGIL